MQNRAAYGRQRARLMGVKAVGGTKKQQVWARYVTLHKELKICRAKISAMQQLGEQPEDALYEREKLLIDHVAFAYKLWLQIV